MFLQTKQASQVTFSTWTEQARPRQHYDGENQKITKKSHMLPFRNKRFNSQ